MTEQEILEKVIEFQKSQMDFDREIKTLTFVAEGHQAKMRLALMAKQQKAFMVFFEQYRRTMKEISDKYKARIEYLSEVEKIISESFPELSEKIHELRMAHEKNLNFTQGCASS